MSWPIRIVLVGERLDLSALKVGDGYYLNGLSESELRLRNLTKQYFADNADRPPFAIMLPGRIPFVVDSMCFSRDRGYYDGWVVTGIPPLIRITPSVNFEGRYHGYIGSNGVEPGVIGDDVDGRQFQ